MSLKGANTESQLKTSSIYKQIQVRILQNKNAKHIRLDFPRSAKLRRITERERNYEESKMNKHEIINSSLFQDV